jgi:putative transposase
MLILGERHLRAVLADYQAHCNMARPHQGIAQRVPDGEHDAPRAAMTGVGTQHIRRKPVPGGLINEYTHAAWRTGNLLVTCRILFSSGTGPHRRSWRL